MTFWHTLTKRQSSKLYNDPLGKFSFQYKVNVRKSFRRRSPANTFKDLIDLDGDFAVEPGYDGPMIEDDDRPITGDHVEAVVKWFAQEKLLHRRCIYALLARIEAFYRTSSSTLVEVRLSKEAVIHICGDIHGQFWDLLKILKEKGAPSESNQYLFNGDIVDKGPKSTECILTLFLMKLAHPKWVHVNRGNHESGLINTRNGFTKEVKVKFDDFFMFEYFAEVFRWMPLAHLVSERILVVHGGLSSNQDLTLDDIRRIKRPVEPHNHQLTGELLWSDPNITLWSDAAGQNATAASPRGIGVLFGQGVTKKFLERNDLLCIVRSHSEIKEGCGMNHEGCYTVYSAPSRSKGVLAGIMTVEGKHLTKEGSTFPEVIKDEIEAFKRGEFWKKKTDDNLPSMDTDQKLQMPELPN